MSSGGEMYWVRAMPNGMQGMNMRGRDLNVGDSAATDWNGGLTTVTITGRKLDAHCQSGTMFQVTPALRNCARDAWLDADWFWPAERADG
jgi:hypothetical protein